MSKNGILQLVNRNAVISKNVCAKNEQMFIFIIIFHKTLKITEYVFLNVNIIEIRFTFK